MAKAIMAIPVRLGVKPKRFSTMLEAGEFFIKEKVSLVYKNQQIYEAIEDSKMLTGKDNEEYFLDYALEEKKK